MPYPRIHDPPLYKWQLNETHTRYDFARIWPEAGTLHVEFAILATVNAVVAVTVLLLMAAILRSKTVRSNPFNWYLLFIALPDFIASFLCFITCALSAPQSHFYSEWMCGFQSFYLNFSFCANAWMNGLICFQIHRLLKHSNRRRRYTPPTQKQVMTHAAIVYSCAFVFGLVCGFNLSFLPHSTHLYYGFACMPMEYNLASTVFFYLVYLPLMMVVPIVFSVYVLWDIFHHNLLPPVGRRRRITIFLFRLCLFYFLIWTPFLVLSLIGNFVIVPGTVLWTAAAISHLQGLICAGLCLFMHSDIRESAFLLLSCSNKDVSGTPPRQSTNSRFSFWKSVRSSALGPTPSVTSQHQVSDVQTGRPDFLCIDEEEHGGARDYDDEDDIQDVEVVEEAPPKNIEN